jgi:uncharacterized protein (DUF433 family)
MGIRGVDNCPLVERVPGKMSSEPVIRGTRVLARTILDNFVGGSSIEEIHENYPQVSLDTIQNLIVYFTRLNLESS